MSNALDLLLKAELPGVPEKEFKMKRLSELCGADVVFSLKALSYSRVADIRETCKGENMSVHIVLAGVTSPDLKSKELLEKYRAATPVELVKVMLLPGEVEDLGREIEKLSGFRQNTVEEVKKK